MQRIIALVLAIALSPAALAQVNEPEGVAGMRLGMTEQELAASGVATRVVPSLNATQAWDRVPFYWKLVEVGGEVWSARPRFGNGILSMIEIDNELQYVADKADGDTEWKTLAAAPSLIYSKPDCDRRMDELAAVLAKRYKKFDGPPKVLHDPAQSGFGEATDRRATMTFPTRVIWLLEGYIAGSKACHLQIVMTMKGPQSSTFQ